MTQKTILVTGGSKGIGRAVALQFAADGFHCIICARNEDELRKTAGELERAGGTVSYATCNVRDRESIRTFVENTVQGRSIDVLVNNVGTYVPGQIHTEEDGVFELMMETNLHSTYHFSRMIVPLMKAAEKPHIFNICSTASITAYANGGSYCISKFAQYGLTKVLREELKPFKIRVTAVLPGATRTSSWDGTDLPESRFVLPDDVATSIHSAYGLRQGAVVEDLIIRPMEGDII
ncbi:MAG: SDR family oxidoreductase [Flavobacteriales bacterium]|nr:SDR family oxidoreductase [Bacteroidota bacterium]MCB9239693.1 SDR family oxidoreductase [Flavobacteriales bacterium]